MNEREKNEMRSAKEKENVRLNVQHVFQRTLISFNALQVLHIPSLFCLFSVNLVTPVRASDSTKECRSED
jgi:hypothetical protein